MYPCLPHTNVNNPRLRRNVLNSIFSVKGILSIISLGITIFFIACRIEANARVFKKSIPELQSNYPLSHCLDLPNKSPYNHGQANHSISITPGVPLWKADTCFDFAGLIKSSRAVQDTLFHTYWSSNITDFGSKQLDTLRSFIATQDANHAKLIVWVPSMDTKALVHSARWKTAQELAPERIEYKEVDYEVLANNTPFANHLDDWREYVGNHIDHDRLLRLFVLGQYGGVWFDLDTLLVRDMGPLLEHEWISQGDCVSSMEGNPFDGGLLHFKPQSPFVCEMLETAFSQFKDIRQAESFIGRQEAKLFKLTEDKDVFGSQLYYRVYRNILHHRIKPWSSLPWCFTDGSLCKSANALPSLTSQSKVDTQRMSQIFAYRWHDQWGSQPGSLYRYITHAQQKITS
ncbi:hypothetical protein CLU79DRAFT_778482 [Phycomyces nitens]|nr:hypothetical protein CLU79DRAFT_778482 [Phycomyces nitens]